MTLDKKDFPKSLANPYPKTPAMAAGLTNHIWNIEELVKLIV